MGRREEGTYLEGGQIYLDRPYSRHLKAHRLDRLHVAAYRYTMSSPSGQDGSGGANEKRSSILLD